MKEPKCTFCGGPHYRMSCFTAPKKPIKVREPIKNVIKKPIKKSKRPPQRSSSERSRLIREADRIFSIYIRLSDSLNGKAFCFTCTAADDWHYMQNGHYINRRFLKVRWSEINCHVQCDKCNVVLGGNLKVYKGKLGDDILDKIRDKVLNGPKVTNSDIQEIIDIYTKKVYDLRLEKGFDLS